jgi:hypothetical protein
MRQTPAELLAAVEDLDAQLDGWRKSLPAAYHRSPPYVAANLPPGMHQHHAVYASCVYNSDRIAMHSLFCHPWNGISQDRLFDVQRHLSTEIVADAARSIIKAIQGVSISAATPVWFALLP